MNFVVFYKLVFFVLIITDRNASLKSTIDFLQNKDTAKSVRVEEEVQFCKTGSEKHIDLS